MGGVAHVRWSCVHVRSCVYMQGMGLMQGSHVHARWVGRVRGVLHMHARGRARGGRALHYGCILAHF